MKTIIFLISIFILSVNSYGQDLTPAQVPVEVKAKFESMYPDEKNPKWEKENGYYEAEFKNNGKETSLIFESNGELKQTETEIPVSELPQDIPFYVSKRFVSAKITEAVRINDKNDVISYEIEIGNKDYRFDSNGNLLGEEEDKPDDNSDGLE